MNRDEMITALQVYESDLTNILSRFSKSRDGIHINPNDDAQYRAMVLQLRDIFNDEFVDGRNQSHTLVSYFNEGISNFTETPSYRGVENVKGVVTAALTRVKRSPLALKEAKLALGASGTKDAESLVRLANRFHLVARQLRERREQRPTLDVSDEYDVQDLFHALLTLFFEDIRKEEWTPSYAGSGSRMDFLLPELEAVVELKKTRPSLTTKQLGEQLIIDIARYKKHPMCRTLFCIVYDPEGKISNPRGVENDLNTEKGEISVRVMIVPK
jgi:hypothetical protein